MVCFRATFYTLSKTLLACRARKLRFLKVDKLLNNAFNYKIRTKRRFSIAGGLLAVTTPSSWTLYWLYVLHTGADPGFSFRGGGGRKRLCARPHIMSVEPNSLSAGVQGQLKGPGSSRLALMLFRAIWALFLSILIIKIGFKNTKLIQFYGGARLLRLPPPPPLGSTTDTQCC